MFRMLYTLYMFEFTIKGFFVPYNMVDILIHFIHKLINLSLKMKIKYFPEWLPNPYTIVIYSQILFHYATKAFIFLKHVFIWKLFVSLL